jgi:hypothetical protein
MINLTAYVKGVRLCKKLCPERTASRLPMSASLAMRCFVVPLHGIILYCLPTTMQCWLVLCGKRKMIFTSSRSRLSITTPHHQKSPNCYTARFWALDTAPALSLRGDSRTLNLQTGVQDEPFAFHALSKQIPTASCERIRRSWKEG